MSKIYENGIVREMTKEEIEELANKEIPEETIEYRLSKLENLFNKISNN